MEDIMASTSHSFETSHCDVKLSNFSDMSFFAFNKKQSIDVEFLISLPRFLIVAHGNILLLNLEPQGSSDCHDRNLKLFLF